MKQGETRLPDPGTVQVFLPSSIQTLMSGCRQISKNAQGVVTALYSDGAEESIEWPEADLTGATDFFSVLGTIQSRRTP